MEAILLSFNDDDASETVEQIFTCSICLGTLSKPKVLPKCGHTFCLRCLVAVQNAKVNQKKITCPECRTIQRLASTDLSKELKTNFAVEKAVNGFSQKRTGKSGNDFDECPHCLIFNSDELTKCEHCNQNFCDGCGLRHAEMLRLELNWHFRSMQSHLEKISSLIDGKMNLQEEIDSAMRRIVDILEKRVVTLNVNSLLYLKLNQVAKTFKAVRQREGQAFAILKALPVEPERAVAIALGNQDYTVETLDWRFHEMARTGDLKALKAMFELPNLPSECRKYLLEHRDQSHFYFTVLHQTAKNGHLAVVEYFVNELGADCIVKTPICRVASMPIHCACSNGHVNIVKLLLEKATYSERDMSTIISISTFFGMLDVVKFLVNEKGADIDKLCDGMAPLHLAACRGFLDVVRFFVEKGANLRLQNEADVIPIEKALVEHHVDIVRYFLEVDPGLMEVNKSEQNGYNLVHSAAQHSFKVLKFLVEEVRNVDVSSLSSEGLTPLHYACANNRVDCVRLLVEYGADPLAANSNCADLPIHIAAKNGNLDVVKYFLELRPEMLEVKNEFRETPLSLAVFFERQNLVEFLRSKGATKERGLLASMAAIFGDDLESDDDNGGAEEVENDEEENGEENGDNGEN